MSKPNTDFHLTVKELALIEMALIAYSASSAEKQKDIKDLLAKFYNQKL